jgi:ApeA N-terminal domain 1
VNLAQCIETYHRRRYGGKYQPDEEYRNDLYRRFIDAIPQDLNGAFRQSLRTGKLWYANEYSLRKRLREISDRLASLSISFLNTKEVREKFIEKVCDTRNYLTHYDSDLQANAATGVDLFELKEQLKLLLEISLLEELGFSLDKIKHLIENNQGIKRFFKFIIKDKGVT